MQSKTESYQARQGDVLIERVDAKLTGHKKVGKSVVLAHGEATGHHHLLECEESIISRQDNPDGSFYLRFASDATVTHQEHARIALPKGTYRISRQREYHPQAVRNVAD